MRGPVRDVRPRHGKPVLRLIGETSTLVAVINAALAAVIVGLVANAAGSWASRALAKQLDYEDRGGAGRTRYSGDGKTR